MKHCFYTIFLCLFFSISAKAQCEDCAAIPEETFTNCFTDLGWPGHCVMYTNSESTFYYEDKDRKKRNVMQFPFPGSRNPDIEYLLSLQLDRRLKLKSDDLAFIQKALESYYAVQAVEKWEKSSLNTGYTITSSGLAYKVLESGKGNFPSKGSSVSVHYTGYFLNGEKFDSSRDRAKPFSFLLGKGQVIKGWDEGVRLMKPSSRFLFRIPAELAYGARGYPGGIPPNSVLLFDVQLLKVE